MSEIETLRQQNAELVRAVETLSRELETLAYRFSMVSPDRLTERFVDVENRLLRCEARMDRADARTVAFLGKVS